MSRHRCYSLRMHSKRESTRRSFLALAAACVTLPLAACVRRTKDEILKRAEGVKTRAELEAALGAPDERNVIAMLEHWTYRASDGEVTFHVAGDRVMFVDTVGIGRGGGKKDGEGKKKEEED